MEIMREPVSSAKTRARYGRVQFSDGPLKLAQATMNADTGLKQTLLARENEWMSAWQRRDRRDFGRGIYISQFPRRRDLLQGTVAGRSYGPYALRVISIRRRSGIRLWRHSGRGVLVSAGRRSSGKTMERALRHDRHLGLSSRTLAGGDPTRYVARCASALRRNLLKFFDSFADTAVAVFPLPILGASQAR